MTSPHETGRDSVPEEAERSAPAPQEPREAAAPHGASRPPVGDGPGWSDSAQPTQPPQPSRPPQEATTVLPGLGRPGSVPPRPAPARAEARPGTTRPVAARARRARLTWKRIDPWSVFLFTLVASVFLGIALIVAAAVLYAVLGVLGVTESLNELYAEVTGGDVATEALLTSGRILGFATILALVNVVFLTLLATLGAMLYNLCASFTGGLELTFGERD